MFKNLLLLSLVVFVSCSTLSKNMTTEGELTLRGGIFRDKEWQESITFERRSWYLELTLAYDLMTAPASKDSPFFNWFGPSEKEKINSCADAKILVMYSWDKSKISYEEILMQLKKQGYNSFLIPEFSRQFRMHPNFNHHSLHLYSAWGICSQEKRSTIKISVPGFKQITHDL